MKLTKILTFIVLFMLAFGFITENTANAQIGSSGTSATQVNYPNGPVYKFSFTNVDSLTVRRVTKPIDIGLISADTNYFTYFSNFIAGDTTQATVYGGFEYDSAGVTKLKWDSCATVKMVGTTDSNQIKQTKMYFTKYYSFIKIGIFRPSGATVPILPLLSDRVYYITISSKRVNWYPDVKSWNNQIPNN